MFTLRTPYRWMSPEIIRHENYSLPADVYSFGIVLWELLSRQQPYAGMTPVQAAFAVARQNMRPRLPSYVPKSVAALIKACWNQNPRARPTFERIIQSLETILESLSKAERKLLDCAA
jgi:serine/threonine protein kinase